VGRDEKMIREYIKNQEAEERREEAAQLNLFEGPSGPKGGNSGPLWGGGFIPGPSGPVTDFCSVNNGIVSCENDKTFTVQVDQFTFSFNIGASVVTDTSGHSQYRAHVVITNPGGAEGPTTIITTPTNAMTETMNMDGSEFQSPADPAVTYLGNMQIGPDAGP
jgi:hypothetical protein